MKKRFILLITAIICLAFGLTLVACNDDEGGGGDGGKGTAYSIQAPAASDVYTVEGLPENACEGDAVKFKVTLTDPENSMIESVSVDYDELTADADGYYTFTMPAEPVKVEVEVRAFSEVLVDGGIAFSADNPTEITVNGDNGGGYWTEDNKWVDCWKFNVTVGFVYTTALAKSSYAVSSNQNVIPDNAIKITAENDYGSGLLKNVEILIDSSKISPGRTWLEIHLQSDNVSSNRGTVCVQITVAETVALQTMKENVEIDFNGYAEAGDDVIVRFYDEDYFDGSTVDGRPAAKYLEFRPEIEADGTATITFDYVVKHEYTINIYKGTEWFDQITDENKDNILVITDDKITGGSTVTGFDQYIDGRLSFVNPDVTIELTVSGTYR